MARQRRRGRRRAGDRPDPFDRLPAGGPEANYKQNHREQFICRLTEPGASIRSSLARFADVYRHHAAVFSRYCDDRRFTPKQLRTIEALYIEGLSMHEFAAREGVEPQAISARIASLGNGDKAREFCEFWRDAHAGRQRRIVEAGNRGAEVVWDPGSLRLPADLPSVLSIEDVARLLDISPVTVELHARCGVLKCAGPSGLTFSPADVRVFVNRWLARGGVFRIRLPRFFANPWCIRPKRDRPDGSSESFAEAAVRRNEQSLRYRSKKVAQYRNSGLFLPDELSLIECRLHEREVQDWATRHGVSAEQALDTLDALEGRARLAGLPGFGKRRRGRR